MKNKRNLIYTSFYLSAAMLFVIPSLASAGSLTLSGSIPVGSSLTITSHFEASTHLWPLCGTPGLGDGFEPSDEFQDSIAQVNPDGTYEVSVNFKAEHHLPNDPLGLCKPKLSSMNVTIVAPGVNEGKDFTVYLFDPGMGSVDLSTVKVAELGTGNMMLDGKSTFPDGSFIPNFSDKENYRYSIQIESR